MPQKIKIKYFEKVLIFLFSCDIISRSNENAAMAQSVEHVIGNDEVISSILISSSRKSKPAGLLFLFIFLTNA